MSERALWGACLALLILLIAFCSGLFLDATGPDVLGSAGFYPTVAVGVCFGGLGPTMRALCARVGLKSRRSQPVPPTNVEVHEVVRGVVETLAPSPKRLRLAGPQLQLPPQIATVMALILHELAIDARARGAWSNDAGVVTLGWTLAEQTILEIRWQESGGPPTLPASKPGFALTLIERGLNGASIDRQHLPEGLLCVIRLRSDRTSAPA